MANTLFLAKGQVEFSTNPAVIDPANIQFLLTKCLVNIEQ